MADAASGAHRRPTLRDVAGEADVSLGTASNALNGSDRVRPQTRTRVLAAAQRLGYSPNPNAVQLLRGRTGCVSVVHPGGAGAGISANTFYSLVVRGVTAVLQRSGYTMRIVAGPDGGQPDQHRRLPAIAFDADGLIILNWQPGGLAESIASSLLPVVVTDSSGGYPGIPSVDNDDRGGVASGVGHLLDLGHRRIALLTVPISNPFGQETLAGYLHAHEQRGVPVFPQLIRSTAIGISSGHAVMSELIAGSKPVTAVMAATDELAVGALRAVEDAGLRCPADVSVVGMDDIPLATVVRPELTTVRVDLAAIGERSATMLISLMKGEKLAVDHVTLPTRLIARASTALLDHNVQ